MGLKLTAEQAANLTPHDLVDIEAEQPDIFYDVKAVRMIKGVTKIDFKGMNSQYFYRGVEIRQDDGVPKGYYGRWKVGHGKRSHGFETLEDAVRLIDKGNET